MQDADLHSIVAWLAEQGLSGASEQDLLMGFCRLCAAQGLPLDRAMCIVDTLHPVYEGRAFRWRNDGVVEDAMVEYGRTTEGPAATTWHQSVFFHLLTEGLDEMRHRLAPDRSCGFTQFDQMGREGYTDVVAHIHRFAQRGVIGEMDCVYSHWGSRRPEGFDEAGLAALRRLLPPFALAIKCASLARIAATLVEVYLGRDAGQLVLSGNIKRGVADRITAVLWFSDLRGYTAITEKAAPDEILPLLNDYADAVISSVEGAGGDVLKLIGDGILAIFRADDPGPACRCALDAEAALRQRLVTLNLRRSAEGRPTTEAYLGLHIGEVFYGNIGSDNRLDFTVVGPAVNEVSRIAAMCRSADQRVLVSSDFTDASLPSDRARLVSVGRYALRGVRRPRELFTLDPER